jgi:hypothetical protein
MNFIATGGFSIMDLRQSSLLFVTALAAVVPGFGASAIPNACLPGTFSTYAQQSFCDAGLLRLYNFELYTLDSQGARTAAGSELLNTITVSPVWTPGADGGGNLELSIQGFTGMNNGPNTGWQIRFTVDPPPIIGGEDIFLDPPFGSVFGFQAYCADDTLNSDQQCTSTDRQSVGFGIGDPAQLRFTPPLAVLDTLTSVTLGDQNSGFDGLIFSISAVPEPSSWALLLGAGGLVTWLRRRKS